MIKRITAILEKLGIALSKDAHMLDFGCGAGRTVYSFRDQGYMNVVGYDIQNYLELRHPEDRSLFHIAEPGVMRLPFKDESFDLVISDQVLEHVMDQVGLLRELHRIMRPDGCAIHVFPARYSLIEPHIYVPLGGVLGHRWWYYLWALMGVRNEFQGGLTPQQVAERNALFLVEKVNYVPNSCYEAVWTKLGYEWKWLDQETLDTSERSLAPVLGKLNRVMPVIGWLYRTFRSRSVLLRKVSK